jgi:hypothetical protein
MEGLGRLFDFSVGTAPVLAGASGLTGNRVHLKGAEGVTIVIFTGVGTAGGDLHIDLQEHDAATSGNSQDLDIIDHYYLKAAVDLDGDDTWTKVEQTAASEIDFSATSAEEEIIAVVEVQASSLSDGFEWISVNYPDLEGTDDKEVATLFILRDLHVQRAPANLEARLNA